MFNGNRKFAHFSEIWKRKRQSNIVEFCNSCWKMAKKAPFHMKSPVKNFRGWAKGGAPCPPPLNTPLGTSSGASELLRFIRPVTNQSEHARMLYVDGVMPTGQLWKRLTSCFRHFVDICQCNVRYYSQKDLSPSSLHRSRLYSLPNCPISPFKLRKTQEKQVLSDSGHALQE